MNDPCVKFPVNFLSRDDVRLFAFRFEQAGGATDLAMFLAVRVVFDFAAQGRDWRPLASCAPVDWDKEEIAKVISLAIGWPDEPSHWLRHAVTADFMRLESRGDIIGLICPVFIEFNAHLLPGHLSMQQKGARAAVEARRRRDDPAMATQQRELLIRQNVLDLGDFAADVPQDEIDAAIMLVMQVDRAGGLAMRSTKDYANWMLAAAVRIRRTFTPEVVSRTLEFLLAARIDPTVPKGAELVMREWEKMVERSLP